MTIPFSNMTIEQLAKALEDWKPYNLESEIAMPASLAGNQQFLLKLSPELDRLIDKAHVAYIALTNEAITKTEFMRRAVFLFSSFMLKKKPKSYSRLEDSMQTSANQTKKLSRP